MKKTALIFVLATVLSACTKDITSLNNDPKNPLVVTSASLFTQAQREMCNALVSSSVNVNIFRLVTQQWEETTYTDESNYDFKTRAIPDEFWREFYAFTLINYERAKKLIPTDVTDAKVQKNQIAIADILEVYTYYYLVTTYGNVPYSQASDINNVFPKFDDAATIYNDLLTRLDADIAALDPTSTSFDNADVFYNGDVLSWQKFANSFKLKMGITIADSNPTKAQAVVESAVIGPGGLFTSNTDNAEFKYVASPPNTNQIWVDLVQSGRQDFVASNTILTYMHADTLSTGAQDPLKDPRLPYYFTTNSDGYYAGADVGEGASPFNAYSKPSGPLLVAGSIGKITNPDFPGLMLDYAETEFNLAEAAARGYTVSGSAATHYTNGILASMDYWGVAPADATAYTLLTNVVYNAAGTEPEQLQQIGLQKYLALYNRGVDAWIETRRLDYPALTPGAGAKTDFPVRFTYPVNEQNVNKTNYDAASAAIGGDVVTTKLFFDVN